MDGIENCENERRGTHVTALECAFRILRKASLKHANLPLGQAKNAKRIERAAALVEHLFIRRF